MIVTNDVLYGGIPGLAVLNDEARVEIYHHDAPILGL